MNNQIEEKSVEELKYINERQNVKINKLLDMIANYANTVVELEMDNEMLKSHIQKLNEQLEEAQG